MIGARNPYTLSALFIPVIPLSTSLGSEIRQKDSFYQSASYDIVVLICLYGISVDGRRAARKTAQFR
jgi:hypothetical protein